jgi:hypothetical protein
MSKYLLNCGCGNNVPVDVGQAGGQVACSSCGAKLDVPPLRKLRHLPVAAPESELVQSNWGARQGVVAAGVILAAVLVSFALGSRFYEPAVPEFDPEARLQAVDRGIEAMTPVQGWQMWVELYRPMAERGFAIIQHPHKAAIERDIAQRRFFQKTLLIVAAVFVALALTAALWPRSTRQRTKGGGSYSSPG